MGIEISFVDLHDTTTFFSGKYDVASVFVTTCCAISIYNGLELLLLIFTTFRHFRGLYFWSLLVSSFGLLPYILGFMILYFVFTNSLAGLILTSFGWPMVVTGQSLVLYSRLHVVLGAENHKLLKGVKWMIIIDAIIFHIPTLIVLFGAYYAHPSTSFAVAYKYIEKVQMTGFTIQELIVSGLYVWKTLGIIHATSTATPSAARRKKRTSRIMWQLFGINVFIVIMDVALLVMEFQDRHVFEQSLKGAIYSVKLKLEFAILSKLVALTCRSRKASETPFTGAFEDFGGDSTAPETGTRDIERGRSIFSLNSFQHLSPAQSPQADLMKGEMTYIERVSASTAGLSFEGAPLSGHATLSALAPSAGHDDQRRRRTMDEDLYASALRGMRGQVHRENPFD